jgi:hypothetical protein
VCTEHSVIPTVILDSKINEDSIRGYSSEMDYQESDKLDWTARESTSGRFHWIGKW